MVTDDSVCDAILSGFKRTEIGMIPESWSIVSLSSLCNLRRGFDITEATSENGSVPVYSSSGISYFHNRAKAAPPTLITGRKGLLGKVFLSYAPCWPHDTTLWSNEFGQNNPKFVAYKLSDFGLERLDAATSVPTLNRNNLTQHKIAIPPPKEQDAIAEALSDADEAIRVVERLLAKKRAVKQATLQTLLAGQTRLPGFEGEWTQRSLSKHATLKARIGWQGLTTEEYLPAGNYLLVTGTDFIEGRVNWTSCVHVEQMRYDQDHNIQLKTDDVLVTKDGTIGKVALVDSLPKPATLNSGVFVIRPTNRAFCSRFLFHVLRSNLFVEFLNRLSAGSTINHLYQKDFVDFQFDVPAFPEQQAIANVLSDMDTELEALTARLDKLRAIKQGMMQELLTGRTRLV